jgi:hypothetical protein
MPMKMKSLIISPALIVGMLLTIGCARDEFSLKLDILQLGQEAAEIRRVFGQPDLEFAYEDFTIYYYRGSSTGTSPIPGGAKSTMVSGLSDLPDLYGYLQVLFDTEMKLVAYALIGESYHVESIWARPSGSHLRVLEPFLGSPETDP